MSVVSPGGANANKKALESMFCGSGVRSPVSQNCLPSNDASSRLKYLNGYWMDWHPTDIHVPQRVNRNDMLPRREHGVPHLPN